MDGVYLFHTTASASSSAQKSNATTASPDPAVIVLTEPQRDASATTTVCDVDLLQLLYFAFPSSFFLLVSPADGAEPRIACASHDAGVSPLQVSAHNREQLRRAQAKVDAFFGSSLVQQRTCRLTLGSRAEATAYPHVAAPAQRHSLLLSPLTAVSVMREQPWLKDLHECSLTLFHPAQVAAVLLLAANSKLFLHTSAALEVVTRCAWVGDAQSAAAVLASVAHAICQPAAGAGAASGFTALAQAQQRTPPSMPAWVTGGPQEACSRGASPPLPQLSPLLPLPEGGKDKQRRAQLCMQEAYSTYTAATATTPAASVVGGFIGLSCSAAEAEASRLKGGCSSCPLPLNASSGEVVHLIVCTALTVTAEEHAEDAVRPRARHVLPPLLRFLKKHMCDDKNNESGAAAVQLHVSVSGRDVLAQPPLVKRQQQTTTMMRDEEASVAPLTACSLAEATERLSPSVLDSVAPLSQFYDEEEDEEDGAAEDVVSYMLRQCNATLRRVQQEAHRHRLLRMRHQHTSPDAPLTSQTTRAAVVLCVDEAHLAQWAESRHPFLPALSSDASHEGDTTHAELPLALRWALYADVPVYVCLVPSAAVTPPLLLSRLCAAPAIEKGVRAARQLCSLTGGFFFIADSPAGQAGKSGAPASGKGDEADVVQQCAAAVAALVAHFRLWATAVFRSIHYCVLSEPPAETQTDATASPAAQRLIALPHCALCTPSAVMNIRAAAAQVRLWRCPGGLLSPTTPAIPFLAYETLGARTGSGSQPWADEMVAHYVFAFADATASAGSCCTVSPVVRVQPRLTLCRPGPLLRWYSHQYHLHSAVVRLAAVHAAQVEQLKTMFFVLAATEGGRGVRRGVVSAQAREAQAEAVLTALQRLTKDATQLQEKEKSLLQVLHHLLPFESMEGRNTAQQTDSSALPEPLAAVIQEVEAERRAQLRAQQRKAYQLGEPLAPSSTDTSAAATRLLSLTFLRARLLALHALYAAGGADAVLRHAHQADKAREEGQSGEETMVVAEAEPAAASMVTKRSVKQRASDLYRDVLASASAPAAAQQGEASVHEEAGHRNSPPPAEHAGPYCYPHAEHNFVVAPAHEKFVAVELETAQVPFPDVKVIPSSGAVIAELSLLPADLPINKHEDEVDVGEKSASCVAPSGIAEHQQMHHEAFVRSSKGDGWSQEPRGIFTVDAQQRHTQPAPNTTPPFQPDTTAADTTTLPVPRSAPEVVMVEPAAYASPPVHLHNDHSDSQHKPQLQYHQHIDVYRRRQSFDVRLPSSAERAAYTSCAGCSFDVQPSTAREAYQDVDVVTAPALASPSMPSVKVAKNAGLNEEAKQAAHEASPWVYLPGEMKDGEEQPAKTEEHDDGREHADQEESSAVVVPAADQKSSDSKLSHAGATMQKPSTEGREKRDTYLTVSVHEATLVSPPPPPRPPTPPLTPLEARNVCSANNAAPPQPSAPSCLRCEAEASTVQQDGNALNALPGVAEDLSYLQLAGTMSAAATTQPPIVASAPLDDQLTGGFPMASVDEANGDDGGAQLNATLQREEGSVIGAKEAGAASDVPAALRSHTNASPAFQQEERDQEDVQSTTSTHASADTCRPNSALRTWRPSACSPSGDSGVAAEQTPPAEGMKTTQRHCRTPLGIPPPPCNMTWWSERAGGAAGAVSAPQQHTALASLLTEQLPPQATARTAALHVARYAGGRLTVDVLDPTTAFLAAAANARAGNASARVSPAAYIALFTIDVNTGALCLCEAHACPIAPGITADMLVEQQSSHMRTRHTFTTSLSPGTAVAVIYVGLRHALMKGVARDDVTWLNGIALSVESPAVRQVRVSDIQSDGFCLEWESSSSTAAAAQAAVKILTTEIATPPPCGPLSFLAGEAGAASGAKHTTAAAAASAAAMRGRRRMVNVAHASPAIVTGLRSASIYHVQLIPTPLTGRTVRVAARHRPSSVPSSSSLQLEWVVDADVCVCAVMAATSLAPSPDMVRVREVSVADAHQSAAPSVTGVITCSMLHYRTAVFPLSLLRHCALVDTTTTQQKPKQKAQADVPLGAASAHQLVRLHWTTAPLLDRDTSNDTTTSEECGSAVDGFHIAVAGSGSSSRAAGRLGGDDGLIKTRSRRSSRCFAYSDTCRHVFRVHAGAEVNVALSLCVQLDAELVSLTAPTTKDAGPVALHYVSLLEALQRSVLPVVLGPFHVCRVPLDVRCDGPSVSELAWEGTCPVFDVVVRKRRTEASAALADAALPPTESHAIATNVPREDGSRPSTANEDEDEQTYQVKGRLVVKDGAGATAAAAEDGVVARPPPLYRGVLRLSALHPSSEYEARVRCATHHIGEHLQCLWHTRPLPPPRRALSAIFDSNTRCLHLRFTQHLVADEQQLLQLVDAPRALYHAVVAPLGTSITVPVWAAAAEKKSDLTVHRVVDCSVVGPNTPISLYLRRRVEWPTSTTQHKEEALVSSDVVYVVVSGIRVSMVYSGVAKNVPMLELAWTCCEGHEERPAATTAPSEDQAPLVSYVELNHTHRVRVKAETRNRVRLALSQLRFLTAAAGTTLSTGLLAEASREDEVKEDCEGFLPYSWSGVVCITAFVSSAGTTSRAGWPGAPIVVPDRCLPVILPPPPALPLSVLVTRNYESEASVDVDVGAVYSLYYAALSCSEHKKKADEPEHRCTTSHLGGVLRQRVRLALDVQRKGVGVSDNMVQQPDAAERYPLQPPSGQQSQHHEQQQRIRIPLPSYRPYDGYLCLSLHVSVAEDPRDVNPPADRVDANRESDTRRYRFFIPADLSPTHIRVPVPPAEPIADIAVSAISACDAVLDWTPPQSLLRRLRQQPPIDVSYAVQLFSATAVPSSDTATPAALKPLREPAHVWVSAVPHLVLNALEPATPYVVVVRGTGCGDYYATVRFVTAPVVAGAVVTQLRSALTVEAVVQRGGGGVESAVRGRGRGVASVAGVEKSPALWTVLPASDVVRWTLPSHLCSDVSAASVAEGLSVEVATHYSLCLVAATGELLRRWTSSPGTTTTVYHEWEPRSSAVAAAAAREAAAEAGDDVSSTPSMWPHLEVMAHAELLMGAFSSSLSPGDGGTAAAAAAVATLFTLPHACHSGAYHRTRLDLIGMARLVEPQSSETCAVSWEGSCREGYHLSWCLSPSLARLRHAKLPAGTQMPCVFSLPSAAVSDVVGEGSVAGDRPVFAVLCVSGGGRRAQRSRTSGASPSLSTSPTGVVEGGSNVLCVAWLLRPGGPAHGAPQDVAVVRQASDKVTLLLPRDCPLGTSALSAVGEAAGTAPCDLTRAVRSLLTRTWAITAPRSLLLRRWPREAYATCGLPSDGSVSLVDVHLPSSGQAQEAAVVELQCVDAVAGKQSAVWQQLVAHVVDVHQRWSGNASESTAVPVLPSLRWLRTIVETRRAQPLRHVRTLQSLELVAVEECSEVRQPPLLSTTLIDGSAAGEAAGAADNKESSVQRLRVAWLPLRTAAAPEKKTRSEGGGEQPCALQLRIGEPHDGEEEPRECKRSEAAARTQATLSELSALQAWGQRGHPTLCARLAWVSDDDVFVLRVAGPYETAAAATSQVCNNTTSDNHHQDQEPPLPLVIRTLLNPDVFPTLSEMPHQRTYTCVAPPRTATAAGLSGGHLALQPNGEVRHVVAVRNTGDGAADTDAGAAAAAAVVLPSPCQRFTAEVDGLVPEAFYRLQVTGVHSGDVALRVQFVTPPSALTQVVTVGEASEERRAGADVHASAQAMQVHARLYNPHAYAGGNSGAELVEQHRGSMLAPGVRYESYAALEVRSRDAAKCLRNHRTYWSLKEKDEEGPQGCSSQPQVVEKVREEANSEAAASLSTTTTAFTVAVKGPVEVYAVHHLCVFTDTTSSFLQTQHWGPLLLAPSPHASHGPAMSTHVELPICFVPGLPRVEKLAVQRRTPHSLRLSWRWWSGQHNVDGTNNSSNKRRHDPARALPEAEAPPTLLCVRCRRVSQDDTRLASPQQQQQQQQQHVGDICTIVVPATTSPAVTLAPLQPGALYLVGIQEIPREQAAGARAAATASPASPLASLFAVTPPTAAHAEGREGDLYAIRILPLPPDIAAAVRALGRVSARPSSLLLRPARRTDLDSLPRGAVRCYALTSSSLRHATASRSLVEIVRRRPGLVSLALPRQYGPPCRRGGRGDAAAEVKEVRVLSYTAVVVVPENTVYIPAEAVAEVQSWWESTVQRSGDAAPSKALWEWWADRLRTTLEREGEAQSAERHAPASGTKAGSVGAAGTATEHWTSELARRLSKRPRAAEKKSTALSAWPLLVKPMEAVKGGNGGAASTPASWCFTVPVDEPTCTAKCEDDREVKPSASPHQEWVRRTLYLVHCLEALPSHSSCGVVGGAQQLTVCHAPIAVKRLQLLRDVCVRSTPIAATDGLAELRVTWRWQQWAQPSAGTEQHSKKSKTGTAAQPQPRCRARLTCTPLPATSVDGADAAASASAAPASAAFLQHVDGTQREATVTGLSPSTLYRLAFDEVRHGTCSTAVQCAEAAVTALTPPSPPEPGSLPKLHYTRFPKGTNAAEDDGAGTKKDGSDDGGAAVTAAVEVRFDLPHARRTPQGLLVCWYAVLVHREVVEGGACTSAEDFLAVAEEVNEAATATAAGTAPVVYCNVSQQQRLRTRITVRQQAPLSATSPLLPQYALVFFTGVRMEGSGRDATANQAEKGPAESAPAKVMYSAPAVRLLQFPETPLAHKLHEGLVNRQRWLRCRPAHLVVHERTPTSLVLRWQLDLTAARLSDLERLRLLRCGVFAVHVAPDWDSGASATNSSLSSLAGRRHAGERRGGQQRGEVTRTVFYRANASTIASTATTPSFSETASVADQQRRSGVGEVQKFVRRIAVSKYLTNATTKAAGTTTDEDAAKDDAGAENKENCNVSRATAAVVSSPACLTYELIYPCPTPAAAHVGYTVEVALLPDWMEKKEEMAAGGISPRYRSLRPTPVNPPPAATLTIPPVVLPLPVQRIVATDVTQTSCTLEWFVADGERPSASAVHYTPNEEHAEGGVVWVRSGQQSVLMLRGLSPQTSYTVCVVPCNAYEEPCEENNAVLTVRTASLEEGL